MNSTFFTRTLLVYLLHNIQASDGNATLRLKVFARIVACCRNEFPMMLPSQHRISQSNTLVSEPQTRLEDIFSYSSPKLQSSLKFSSAETLQACRGKGPSVLPAPEDPADASNENPASTEETDLICAAVSSKPASSRSCRLGIDCFAMIQIRSSCDSSLHR